MIVRKPADVKTSGGFSEKTGCWSSARYLLKSDNVGFTITMTEVCAGQVLTLEYKHHIEANLIIDGSAVLTDLKDDSRFELGAGDMYALDQHDRHKLQAITNLKLVCVFTPALTGKETHDKDGSYPRA